MFSSFRMCQMNLFKKKQSLLLQRREVFDLMYISCQDQIKKNHIEYLILQLKMDKNRVNYERIMLPNKHEKEYLKSKSRFLSNKKDFISLSIRECHLFKQKQSLLLQRREVFDLIYISCQDQIKKNHIENRILQLKMDKNRVNYERIILLNKHEKEYLKSKSKFLSNKKDFISLSIRECQIDKRIFKLRSNAHKKTKYDQNIKIYDNLL